MTTMTSPTQLLLQLGVFDDGDVLPTIVMCVVTQPIIPMGVVILEDFIATVAELREAAEIEYGRKFPHTAEFWTCSPKP